MELQLDLPVVVQYTLDDFATKPEAWIRMEKYETLDWILKRMIDGFAQRCLNEAETDNKSFLMAVHSKHDNDHYLINSRADFIKILAKIYDQNRNYNYHDMKSARKSIEVDDIRKAIFVLARTRQGFEYEKITFNQFQN